MRFAARVEYRERQRLRAGDLQAEQNYLLGLAARHAVGSHTWGIVSGLHVSLGAESAIVSPGIAIDGYGREIVLDAQVDLPLKEPKQQFVYLHYCECPQGRCSGEPCRRWRAVAKVFLSETRLPISGQDPDLSIARTAGALTDYPPWPVLLAVIKYRKGKPKHVATDRDYKFAALRGARVASPTGRTVMRVGQENLADPYHFSVLVQSKQGALRHRFAVDRDGNTTIWEDLILTGQKRTRQLSTPVEGISLKATIRAGNGGKVQSRAKVETVKGARTLHITFQSDNPLLQPDEFKLPLADLDLDKLDQLLIEANKNFSVVRLRRIGKVKRKKAGSTGEGAGQDRSGNASPRIDDRESSFQFEPSALRFATDMQATKAAACGCDEPTETAADLPKGLVFNPGSGPLPGLSKDMYCARSVAANQIVTEQLRIKGGQLKKGDLRSQIAIGGSTKAGGIYSFQPWLLFRGNGAVELPRTLDNDGLPANTGFPAITATGSIEQPPIQPDPRDPVFNALSVLAFITGVTSLGSSLLKLSFPSPPPFIEATQPWSYNLELENLSLTESMSPVKNGETITGDNGAVFLRQIPNLPQKLDAQPAAGHAATIVVSHVKTDVPADAETIELSVFVAMKLGGLTVGSTQTSPKIPVRKSPVFDLSELTDPIANGSQFNIGIENEAPKAFTLTRLRVTGLGGVQTPTLPANATIDPGDSLQIGPINVPAATGQKNVVVIIDYKWEDAMGTVVTLQTTKTVRVS